MRNQTIRYKEQDVTIPQNAVISISSRLGGNVYQIINHQATGGGNVYADKKELVSSSNYLVKVDQGNTGALVRPYSIDQIFLTSDAPGDIRVTVIEIDVQDLSFVYNTSQILQIQGAVTVNEPITVDWSGSPTINASITNTPAVTISGTPAVTVSGNVEVANDVGNPIPVTATISGTPAVSITGTPTVTVGTALPAGTNAIGKTTPQALNTSGCLITRIKAAASTNATSVKASRTNFLGYSLYNNTASTKFLRLYNKVSAPTVGTDTPLITIPIPPNASRDVSLQYGGDFSLGFAYAITGGMGDSDTTAVAVDDVTGALYYV